MGLVRNGSGNRYNSWINNQWIQDKPDVRHRIPELQIGKS